MQAYAGIVSVLTHTYRRKRLQVKVQNTELQSYSEAVLVQNGPCLLGSLMSSNRAFHMRTYYLESSELQE